MIVHIAGSLRDETKDIEYLRAIIEVIHDHGAVLALNWLDAAIVRREQHRDYDDWGPFVQNNLDALKRADVVIIDSTHRAFSQGFHVLAALEHKKPTLVVSREDFSTKYIRGISDPLLSLKTYADQDDLKHIVDTFLTQNTVHTKDLRFNIFLTREIARFLEERSRETGRARSEIVRDLIKERVKRRRL
jgi:hypothetical protein